MTTQERRKRSTIDKQALRGFNLTLIIPISEGERQRERETGETNRETVREPGTVIRTDGDSKRERGGNQKEGKGARDPLSESV